MRPSIWQALVIVCSLLTPNFSFHQRPYVSFSRMMLSARATPSDYSEELTYLGEKVVFEGYGKMIRRDVLFPTGRTVTFDILTQKHLSVVVFIWDSATATTTLVKEYHPGPDRFVLGTVAGMYEPDKHKSVLEAAQHELEEEAQLRTDKWYPLLRDEDVHMPFDKYSNNKFIPFLALDCKPVVDAKAMDAEEYIQVLHDVPLAELMEYVQTGQMNVVSTYAIMLGLQKLRELGIGLSPTSR